VDAANPEGVGLPLFAWAEFNLYHKTANKKRVKDVLPVLQKYVAWLDATFKQPNGLYAVPLSATTMDNAPREKAKYLVDFNAAMAVNALYILGDGGHPQRQGSELPVQAALLLPEDPNQLPDVGQRRRLLLRPGRGREAAPGEDDRRLLAPLAEIPNDDKAERIIDRLSDPGDFGAEHPFPTVAVSDPSFDQDATATGVRCFRPSPSWSSRVWRSTTAGTLPGNAPSGTCTTCWIPCIPKGTTKGQPLGAYLPQKEGPAKRRDRSDFPRPQYLAYSGLSTVCLMIENIVGLSISLPRKTVDWIIPNLEIMGIENLSLKRNMITILSNKSGRGWEIHMESEKLYYFTINILGKKKKTLPIPSGKCSMLIDKL
jgi:hypothetical protein